MQPRQLIICGVVLGLTAALVVWYLERFETRRLHDEIRDYLDKHVKFERYLDDHDG